MNNHNFYKSIIEQSPVGYAYHKVLRNKDGIAQDYEFIEVNTAFEKFTGLLASDIIGKKKSELFIKIKRCKFDWIGYYGEIANNGGEKEVDQFSKVSNKWYRVNVASPEKEYLITTIIDISEEKTQLEELNNFFEMNLDLLCIAHIEGRFIKTNKAWETFLGYFNEELKQRKFLEFVHPDDMKATLDAMLKLSQEMKVINFVNRYLCKDGSYRWIEWRSYPNGNMIYATARDITERVMAEETVKTNESKQGKMVANIGDVIVIIDKNGINRYKSPNLKKIFGWSPEELVGLSTWINIHSHDLKMVQVFFDTIMEKPNATGEIECRYRCKEGNYRWVKITMVNLLHDVDICGVLGNYHDITSRKEMEELLRQSEEKYRQITENISDVVWTTDMNLKTTYVSPSVERLIGEPVNVYLNRTMEEKFPVKSLNKINSILLQELEKEKDPMNNKDRSLLIDLEHYRTDKTIISVNMHMSFLRNKNGVIVGIQGITRDITKQKKMEEDLKREQLFIQKILDSLPGIFYLYTYPQLRLVRYNKNHEILLGYEPGEIMNCHLMEWHVPEAKLAIKEVVDNVMLVGQNVLESLLLSKDGKYVPFLMTGVSFDTPQQRYLMGIGVDLTERKKMEESIYNEKEQFKTTLLSVGDGVISTDDQGNVLIVNKVAEMLTGWTQSEASGKPLEKVFNIINEYTREKCDNPVNKVLATGDIIELTNHTILISKDNIERPIEDSAAPIKDEKGNISGVVLVFRDFTEKKQKQEEIEYLSFHDQLTGLYNRRFYEEEIKRLDTESSLPLTLVMGDVNGLKLINDSFGHVIGDELLKKVAQVLTKGCRGSDVIARLGGDEFVILLPKTDTYKTKKLIKRINELASKEKVESISISISFGYETKNNVDENIQEIFKRVEDNMYRHKLYESSSMRSKTIDVIMKTLYEKSNREMSHSLRVSAICEAIAINMNFDKNNVNQIRIAGLMHDIGKMGIDEKVLNKPGELNHGEWEEMMRHPEIGYRILSSANEFSEIAIYVLQHQERWDGRGYPKGLKGKEISLQARIIAIADAYDAMTSDRTYRSALPEEAALAELQKNAGIQFDPEVVKLFIKIKTHNKINLPPMEGIVPVEEEHTEKL